MSDFLSILAIFSILLLEEEEGSTTDFFFSALPLSFCDAVMLDSTSRAASCIKASVADRLSLRIRQKSASKAAENVIFADASLGLISAGILPNILLNLLIKSETDSPSPLFKFPNSEM
jgi:hypothetical protein